MLRLNMATPVTPRNDPNFSPLGVVQAAVLGLTQAPYNTTANLEFIPNMDGFPNGRRLEDDVTRIELQAVAGVALAAIGLWYDDYTAGGSPVTPDLLDVLTYSTGVNKNDRDFTATFPYMAQPNSGAGECGGQIVNAINDPNEFGSNIIGVPALVMTNYPNPFKLATTFKLRLTTPAKVTLQVFDLSGKLVTTVLNERRPEGEHLVEWSSGAKLPSGTYVANVFADGRLMQSAKVVKMN
jgi:hypothetical protein